MLESQETLPLGSITSAHTFVEAVQSIDVQTKKVWRFRNNFSHSVDLIL